MPGLLGVLVLAGCMSCTKALHSGPTKDAGATGGAIPDANTGSDSPAVPPVGDDGAIKVGTGGARGMGGSGGDRLDGPGNGGAVADGKMADTGDGVGCPDANGFIDAEPLCGSMTTTVTRAAIDMLLVLDRSGSMQRSLIADCLCTPGIGDEATGLCSDLAGCTDRWTVMKTALGQMIANRSEIRWGIESFPSETDNACSVSLIPQVPVGVDSAAAAQAQLDAITPSGSTPTAAAIRAVTAYLTTLPDKEMKYILLATDGEPSCAVGQSSTSDMDETLAAITAAARAGFRVYVVGVGPSVGNLDRMAESGGTGSYYSATTQFWEGFSSPSQLAASCTFVLHQPPPDPNNVAVYLDKQLVPKDPENGWTYGAGNSTIELTGSYCEKLQIAAQSTTVDVLFGCPPPSICIP